MPTRKKSKQIAISRLVAPHHFKNPTVLVAVTVSILVGVYMVARILAANVTGFEAEGSMSGNVALRADSSASGGQFILFGATNGGTTPPPVVTPPPPPPPVTTKKVKLIKHGWDIHSPGSALTHRSTIDALPVDGISVYLPGLEDTLSGNSHSLSDYQAALQPFPALTNVTHNFVRLIMIEPSYPWSNDAYWATAADNLKNLAQALQSKGQFDGIIIDTEYYGSGQSPWDYGTTSPPAWTPNGGGATPSLSASAAQTLVQARGKQLMTAAISGWSNVKVLTFFGPWLSEPQTASALSFTSDFSWANELEGPFCVGLAEATSGTAARYIDGGELYNARSTADYSALYNWQHTGMPNSGSMIIPANLRPGYSALISSSFGIYDHDTIQSGWPLMNLGTWQSTITNAMKQADDYVWLYTEAYDWQGVGYPSTPVPQSWLDATRAARLAVP
jgi:hypothetical protein